ncbi:MULTISPECIES: acetyltransferase [unclassified Bradyrhizobium]|uniref:acetyltransferase n=1 Tax=unclassified Bradyrhizobium TaxID=2631580 RepID=UPI00143CF7CC|nr:MULTISPECIES: acetyltransferase [unclassified Bradyrhizobium]
MSIDRILLIGAGGHAMVVLDALEKSVIGPCSISIFDDSPKRIGQRILNLTVQHFSPDMVVAGEQFHISIGDNLARERLFKKLAGAGGLARTVIHPVASIAASASIGSGTFVAARAIIAPAAIVGGGCIVNHGAIIDHECVVGGFCHLAPGSTLAGNVRVGAGVLVGAGANILPGVRIGDAATIGAGAVVTADVPPGATHVGVPARRIH